MVGTLIVLSLILSTSSFGTCSKSASNVHVEDHQGIADVCRDACLIKRFGLNPAIQNISCPGGDSRNQDAVITGIGSGFYFRNTNL